MRRCLLISEAEVFGLICNLSKTTSHFIIAIFIIGQCDLFVKHFLKYIAFYFTKTMQYVGILRKISVFTTQRGAIAAAISQSQNLYNLNCF